jgi:hypothetical protein
MRKLAILCHIYVNAILICFTAMHVSLVEVELSLTNVKLKHALPTKPCTILCPVQLLVGL